MTIVKKATRVEQKVKKKTFTFHVNNQIEYENCVHKN